MKENKIFKIAIDIHGVIDALPEIFAFLSKAVIEAGWEVHILTGKHWTSKIDNDLKKFGISWTNYFSISDYHKKLWTPISYIKEDHPYIDTDLWNATKAIYCKEKWIDLCIDDSSEYHKYFETPYCLFYLKDIE